MDDQLHNEAMSYGRIKFRHRNRELQKLRKSGNDSYQKLINKLHMRKSRKTKMQQKEQ